VLGLTVFGAALVVPVGSASASTAQYTWLAKQTMNAPAGAYWSGGATLNVYYLSAGGPADSCSTNYVNTCKWYYAFRIDGFAAAKSGYRLGEVRTRIHFTPSFTTGPYGMFSPSPNTTHDFTSGCSTWNFQPSITVLGTGGSIGGVSGTYGCTNEHSGLIYWHPYKDSTGALAAVDWRWTTNNPIGANNYRSSSGAVGVTGSRSTYWGNLLAFADVLPVIYYA
ncbi:MAG: hypothetical protein ACXV8R_15445, partial [Acidimicrobiia bacterium]